MADSNNKNNFPLNSRPGLYVNRLPWLLPRSASTTQPRGSNFFDKLNLSTALRFFQINVPALMALAVGPGLNVGKAVMAGLVPATHAAPPQISRLIRLLSIQRLIVRLQCSRGWPGRARP